MLMPVRLPGGDRAVQEPWRMAASWLSHALDDELPAIPRTLRDEVDRVGVGGRVRNRPDGRRVAGHHECRPPLRRRLGALRHPGEGDATRDRPRPSSRAPQTRRSAAAYEIPVEGEGGRADRSRSRPAIRAVLSDLEAGVAVETVAARFHRGLASATAAAAERACRERGLDTVVLSGGVFQNRLLLERTLRRLEEAGLQHARARRAPAQRRRHRLRPDRGRRSAARARLTQVSPTYQSPKRTPNAPRSGISNVR